jgi:hypothetical protein
MENWDGSFVGKVFSAMWWGSLKNDKPLQLIATKVCPSHPALGASHRHRLTLAVAAPSQDIGIVAAAALKDRAKFNHRALDLAGDEVTFDQVDAAFRAAAGMPAPRTFTFLGWAAKKAMGDMDAMVRAPLVTDSLRDAPADASRPRTV